MSSALTELLDERRTDAKRLRANWWAQQWRAKQREQRERQRLEDAAARGLIRWEDIPKVSFQPPPLPGPARTCQWIEAAGCICRAQGCVAGLGALTMLDVSFSRRAKPPPGWAYLGSLVTIDERRRLVLAQPLWCDSAMGVWSRPADWIGPAVPAPHRRVARNPA